jgi:hypothetical protein
LEELWNLAPLVAGALAAGLSAVAKAFYERRDRRLTAHRQLELATKRTEFVSGWLEACRQVGGDDAFAATVAARAREELQEAYDEAQHAMQSSRSVLGRDTSEVLAEQLRWVLLLSRRRRAISYLFVSGYYLVVVTLWTTTLFPDERYIDGKLNEDYMPWWQYAIFAAVSTIVLRVVVGLVIGWIEGRDTAGGAPAGQDG